MIEDFVPGWPVPPGCLRTHGHDLASSFSFFSPFFFSSFFFSFSLFFFFFFFSFFFSFFFFFFLFLSSSLSPFTFSSFLFFFSFSFSAFTSFLSLHSVPSHSYLLFLPSLHPSSLPLPSPSSSLSHPSWLQLLSPPFSSFVLLPLLLLLSPPFSSPSPLFSLPLSPLSPSSSLPPHLLSPLSPPLPLYFSIGDDVRRLSSFSLLRDLLASLLALSPLAVTLPSFSRRPADRCPPCPLSPSHSSLFCTTPPFFLLRPA